MGHKVVTTDEHLKSRNTKATPDFDYDTKVKTGVVSGIHPTLNPALGDVRHSMDGHAGAKSRPMTIFIDVTGSNVHNARVIYKELPKFLGFLTAHGLVGAGGVDIQIIAVGDSWSDRFPIQFSQFESDATKIDEVLSNTILEGGGGGQRPPTESYELAFWCAVNQNDLHGKKGVAFIFFDEQIRQLVEPQELQKIYGVTPSNMTNNDIPDSAKVPTTIKLPKYAIQTKEVVNQLMAMYDCHPIINGGSYFNDQVHLDQWRSYFGAQSVIQVENPEDNLAMMASIYAQAQGMKRAEITNAILTSGLSDNKALIQSSFGGLSIAKNPNLGTW